MSVFEHFIIANFVHPGHKLLKKSFPLQGIYVEIQNRLIKPSNAASLNQQLT